MLTWKVIFFASLLCVFYTYAGYPLTVYLLGLLKKRRPPPARNFLPKVSFIVAAYNEEDCIRDKIINSLSQNYPKEQIEFLFVTDGSTDETYSIISHYKQIKILHEDERRGKSAAMNRGAAAASGDILVFSDANTILNTDAVLMMVRHYADPQTGGVAGEKKVLQAGTDDVAGEGLYWKYESLLKMLDSDFLTVAGAAGELFSVRRLLYEPLPEEVILDDLVISVKVAAKGYRVVYEPEAYATEAPSASIKEEEKRKVRIAAGAFQALVLLRPVILKSASPGLSFLFISHRVLRWTLAPPCLILMLLSSFVLAFFYDTGFLFIFLLQAAFYLAAWAGVFFRFRPLALAHYFVFMHLSIIKGLIRYLRGEQPSSWEKAIRKNRLAGDQ